MQDVNPQRNRFSRLFAFTFCATSSYMICRIVADAVFLTRVGPALLPPMLVASALIVGSVSLVWGRRTRDFSLRGLVVTTQSAAAMLTLVLLILMRLWPESMAVLVGIYVLAELRGCFNAIQLAILLNENFSSRSEQHKFAFVNAASPIAGICVGIFLGAEATVMAPEALLGIACVLDLCSVCSISNTLRGVRVADPVRQQTTHMEPSVVMTPAVPNATTNRHARTFANAILWMVVCKTVVLGILQFEWQVISTAMYPGDERGLAAYFGMFYAVSDGLILFLQLVVTRFLLRFAGVSLSVLLLPLYLTVLGIVSLMVQDVGVLFVVLTAARGSVVLRRGLHDVGLQILYGTLPRIVRRGTVARVLGIAKPLTEAATAVGIGLSVAYVPIRTFAWFWLPVLALWLWWTVQISRSKAAVLRDRVHGLNSV